jgi:uncharacterized membrane protein
MSLGSIRNSAPPQVRSRTIDVVDSAPPRRFSVSLKDVVALLFLAFYTNAAVTHFTDTSWHVTLVPPVLGNALFWVYLTGILEPILGAAMLYRPTRVYAGRASALFLVAIYPANVYMWQNGLPLSDGSVPSTTEHVLRLVFQIVLIAASLWLGYRGACDLRWSC